MGYSYRTMLFHLLLSIPGPHEPWPLMPALFFFFSVIPIHCCFDVLGTYLAFVKSQHFVTRTLISPKNDSWRTSAEIPYDDVSLIPGYCFWLVEANFPCVTTNQSYFLDLSSGAPSVRMVFLRSLLRRLFAGKVELNSLNVGCFLTLEQPSMHCTLNARSRRKQLVLFSRGSLSYPRRSILIYS